MSDPISGIPMSHMAHVGAQKSSDEENIKQQKLLKQLLNSDAKSNDVHLKKLQGLVSALSKPVDKDSSEDYQFKRDLHQAMQDHVSEQLAHLSDVTSSASGVSAMDKVSMDQELAQEGDSVLSGGVSVLYLFMNLLSELANDKYLEMQAKAKVSRDAQDKANEINEQIAAVSKKGDTGTAAIPDDVIQYMSENDVKVDGKSIEDYLKPQEEGSLDVHITWSNGSKNTQHLELKQGKWTHNGQPASVTKEGDTYIWKDPSGNIYRGSAAHDLKLKPVLLDKGKLEAVKAALENISNRASDFVSQSQLQLQKVMQTYNVTVSLLNSMQTMLEEMNKSIAQNVR